MISAKLAPLGLAINARIFAPLLSARGVLASLAGAGLAAFLSALAYFFGAAVLALPPLAAFWPWGASFFWVVPFFEVALSGATVAPCSATVPVCSMVVASAVFMV